MIDLIKERVLNLDNKPELNVILNKIVKGKYYEVDAQHCC